MTTNRLALTATVLTMTAFVLIGCSGEPPKFIVKGKVHDQGNPIPVKPMVGKLQVFLVQQDVTGPVDKHQAIIKDDGSFEIKSEGRGVIAGRYKVCVIWQDDFPTGPDKLKGKLNEQSSPLVVKVPEDGPLDIDVSKAPK